MKFKTYMRSLCLLGFSVITGCAKGSEIEVWPTTLKMKDIGVVQTHFDFTFNKQDNTFFGESPKGSDKLILGGMKAGVARLFNKKLKGGSLIKIQKGEIKGDSLKGVMTTMFGNFYFRALKTNGRIEGKLLNGKREIVGIFDSDLKLKIEKKDYKKLWIEIENITKNKIYDKSILLTKKWSSFKKKMDESSDKFRDDLEFLMGFYYFGSDLGFSHYSAFIPWKDWNEYVKTENKDFEQYYLDVNTYYVKINSFSGSAVEMNEVLDKVAKNKFSNLVVDLRGNSGGSIEAGMTFAERLVKQEITGGIFLTRKHFDRTKLYPREQDLGKYDVFTKANYELLLKGISEKDGIVLKVEPKNTISYERLYFLVDSKTASTCEPILDGFKQNKLAVLIGHTSAGKMLNAEEFKLHNGYVLFLPTATYLTRQGKILDQVGVMPDVFADDALVKVKEILSIKN